MSKNNKQVKNKTPFCKICFDFNRPEAEYTSHWVKDKAGPDGKVTCPYLLNMECRYCHEKGHLISNCPIIKQKKQKKTEKQTEKQTENVVKNSPQQAKPPSLELLQQKLNVEGLPKIPSTLPPLTWLQQPRTKTSKDNKAVPQQAPPQAQQAPPPLPTQAPPPPPTQAPQGPQGPTYADKCKANNTTTTTEKKAPKKEGKAKAKAKPKAKPKRNIYKENTTEKKAPPNPANKNKQSWADIMDDDSDDEENEPSNFWSN